MNRVVYDSAAGRICPGCDQPVADCRCAGRDARPSGDGVVRIRREVRNGKPVTVIAGLLLTAAELRQMAKELKQRCGSGGTARDGLVEIQGDHREVVLPWLQQRGYTVKRAGG